MWAILIPAWAQQQPDIDDVVARICQEAEAFQRLAPLIVGHETLDQKGLVAAGPRWRRIRPKLAPAPVPQREMRTRRIISAYGYSTFTESPRFIHEFREVISVDDKNISTPDKARRALIRAVKSEDDRLKTQMLEDFMDRGLTGAPTDFGQLILLFTKAQIQTYRFAPVQEDGLETEWVFSYEQIDGSQALLFSEGHGKVPRQPIRGQVWLRKSDLTPLQITMTVSWEERETTRIEASVHYAPSRYGTVLPQSVVERQFLSDRLIKENAFTYTGFEKFAER